MSLKYYLWRFFSDAEEEILKNYLKLASGIYCDLSARVVIMFAFEHAVILNMNTAGVRSDIIVTGAVWFTNLLTRHTRLSRANLRQKALLERPVLTRLFFF